MKKIKFKSTKGITLIALVITIIVLLILAGVSIATLTGENGILKQAEEAKAKTEKAAVIERAKTDVFGIQAENEGKISEAEFESILKEYDKDGQVRKNDEEERYIITAKGQEINEIEIYNGEFKQGEFIFNPEELTIGEALNTDKYGWKVKNYTVKTTDCPSGVWRLFYQDSKYTYIINDEVTITQYNPGNYYYKVTDENGGKKYQTGADVSIVGQKLSSRISSLFEKTNLKKNIYFTAWITDPDVWSDYAKGDAIFAIGSPTIELYEASYNNTGKATKIKANGGAMYGYNMQLVGGNWLSELDNFGIYSKSTSSDWWISSPDSGGSMGWVGYYVSGSMGHIRSSDVGTCAYSCRPTVCIPTSVFNSNYSVVDK